MVKIWAEEVEEAQRVIEPIIAKLAPDVRVTFDPNAGFEFDVVALELRRENQKATVLVTFEAYTNARTNPSEMKSAIEDILANMAQGRARAVIFVVTSTGDVITKPRRTPIQRLLDEAASKEADAEVERFKKALAGN